MSLNAIYESCLRCLLVFDDHRGNAHASALSRCSCQCCGQNNTSLERQTDDDDEDEVDDAGSGCTMMMTPSLVGWLHHNSASEQPT